MKLKPKHIRFLGAAGIGMSALIRILEQQREAGLREGLKISKSDLSYAQNDPLDEDIDLVVCSTAIPKNDPDYIALQERGIEFWHRREMLKFLAQDFKQIVATGTHGKTTCSAMIAHILVDQGLAPSFAVGGLLANYDTNGRAGLGEYFVLEGDESDQSFTITEPEIALVTSVEPDHLENYPGGYAEIKEKFFSWLDTAPMKVICLDDAALKEYCESRGIASPAARNDGDAVARNDEQCHREERSDVAIPVKDVGIASAPPRNDEQCHREERSDVAIPMRDVLTYSSAEAEKLDIKLKMPGKYNRLNALAAAKVATLVGIDFDAALKSLESFRGIKRRFELINSNYRDENILVYDDYAHHPTELKALIQGAMEIAEREQRRMLMLYQPHHPERTKQLWDEFVAVMREFPQEHLLIVADIYVARSKHIEGVHSKALVEEVGRDNVIYLEPATQGLDVQGNYSDMKAALCPFVEKHLQADDLLMITGAGNVAKIVSAFS